MTIDLESAVPYLRKAGFINSLSAYLKRRLRSGKTTRGLLWVSAALLLLIACSHTHSRSDSGSLQPFDFRRVIERAKDRVFPAVVFIRCVREDTQHGTDMKKSVSGSGVIISPKGEVVTNWHVIEKAVKIRCLLYGGQALEAHVVGSDEDSDMALLQLHVQPGGSPLPHAVLGDSERLKEGDFVMAMGAPWGLSRSVSIGVVSCVRRYLPGRSEYSLLLQTDASISPGNSGGPLVNTAGEVVGITTLGTLIGGDMGFAIPSDTVGYVAEQLRHHGRMQWSWTGLQLQPLKDFNRNVFFEDTEGVIVAAVDPDSPAQQTGIQPRDRIIKVNGTPINVLTEDDLPDVRRMMGSLPKLNPAKIEVMRGSRLMTFSLMPRDKGKVMGDDFACPRWDLTVKTINRFSNPNLFYQRPEGVFIYGIRTPGNAMNAQLRRNDIILKIDNRAVTTLDDIRAVHKETLEDVMSKSRLLITVLRNGMMRQTVLDISRDYERD